MLAIASAAASAEWNLAVKTVKVDFYTDSATIVRNRDIVKMWSLQDLNQGLLWGKELVLSVKDYQQYDCKQQTRRLVMSVLHSEHMGGGEVVFSLDLKPTDKDWIPVVPGGGGDALWKVACGKK